MNKYLSLPLLFLLTLLLIVPSFSLANGGDQRVVEGKYLINLSRAPFTPHVGVKTRFLPSFFDIEKNQLIAEDLTAKVRIAKLGGHDKRTFIFEQADIRVRGGVLEDLSYVFKEPGLHEIFFDFAFTSNPEKVYGAPDFLIDIQPEARELTRELSLIYFGAGIAVGMLITCLFIIRRKAKSL